MINYLVSKGMILNSNHLQYLCSLTSFNDNVNDLIKYFINEQFDFNDTCIDALCLSGNGEIIKILTKNDVKLSIINIRDIFDKIYKMI